MSEENKQEEVSQEEAPIEQKKEIKEDSEFLRLKAENAKTKRQYEELINKIKAQEVEQMKAKEDWKQIAQLKEEEATDYKNKYIDLHTNIIYDKKLSELKTKALQANIRKEALDDLELVDLTRLDVETTSKGKLNVLGVDNYLSELKVKKPHWFLSTKTNFNTETPSAVNTGDITYKDVKEAEVKWKKSGDKAALADYQKKIIEFKKQNK